MCNNLFSLFDTDGNGYVDFNELASGLSVLCGGTSHDKVRAAFDLYDVNQDGFISFEETVYSLFKKILQSSFETLSIQQLAGKNRIINPQLDYLMFFPY